ncbi:MAG TPA: ABC transporter substrate-binding protein [Acidimicrobiales bacterium]|nr:ABC transporter substrate-binding protein [Acidimicrobiales bacterium]
MRRPLALISAASIGLLSACGSTHHAGATATTGAGKTQPPVVIGSANFPENVVLADIYADALRKAGVPVTTKLNIGSREVYFKEMENGALNVFPEYNGALLDYLKPSTTAASTADVDAGLASALPASLEALKPAPAEDSDSVSVTQAFASAHHLSSIADLKAIESQVTIGAAPEFQNRQAGLVGLQKLYGLNLKFKPLDEAGPLTVAALNGGTVQAADIYTTDPAVAKYHFVALADPKHLFPAQNVIPIVNKSVATPTVVDTLNAVSAALTTADLVQLVGGVVNDHADPGTVAAQFVSQFHLG